MKIWTIHNISTGAVELQDYRKTLNVGEGLQTSKEPQMDTRLLASAKLVKIEVQGHSEITESVEIRKTDRDKKFRS